MQCYVILERKLIHHRSYQIPTSDTFVSEPTNYNQEHVLLLSCKVHTEAFTRRSFYTQKLLHKML